METLPAALDLPLDVNTLKGARAWVNEVRFFLLRLEPGSAHRANRIDLAQKQLKYAEFICRRKANVVAYLAEEGAKLPDLLHTHVD